MNYSKLFEEALSHVLKDYSENKIHFFSERDLQGHLFYECRKLMEEQEFPLPLKLYAKGGFSKHAKVDLVLGDDETLVELKLKPDYPGVSKPVVFNTKKKRQDQEALRAIWKRLKNTQVKVNLHIL